MKTIFQLNYLYIVYQKLGTFIQIGHTVLNFYTKLCIYVGYSNGDKYIGDVCSLYRQILKEYLGDRKFLVFVFVKIYFFIWTKEGFVTFTEVHFNVKLYFWSIKLTN